MSTTWGTSYFVSFKAACDYYRSHGYTIPDVNRKLMNGEIHIGQPCLKPSEHLITIDHDCRYAITEDAK